MLVTATGAEEKSGAVYDSLHMRDVPGPPWSPTKSTLERL